MSKQRRRSRKRKAVTFDTVRELALSLSGAEESTSYGTPAFKVRGKLFARLHQSRHSLVVRIDPNQRSQRMKADPETFYITDHYVNYPWILVRLGSVQQDDLADLLREAWRLVAPSRISS